MCRSRRGSVATVVAALLGASACADAPAPTEPELAPAFAKGGNGKGKPGGETVFEEFDPWDPDLWPAGDHPLGRGWFEPANVVSTAGVLHLMYPAATYDGGEIRSAERHGFGVYEARMKTTVAPGSISAFFLYEFANRRNDEIDIEIMNDGSREIWFTTWVADVLTNHAEMVLPFDPAADFHDYRIEWTRRSVRFLVDGALYVEWNRGVPRASMHVMANAWWPTWLEGPQPSTAESVQIDRILY